MDIKQRIETEHGVSMQFHVDENGDLIVETIEESIKVPHNVATELLNYLQSKLFERRKDRFSLKQIFK